MGDPLLRQGLNKFVASEHEKQLKLRHCNLPAIQIHDEEDKSLLLTCSFTTQHAQQHRVHS